MGLRLLASYSIVTNYQEILNSKTSMMQNNNDVDFKLVDTYIKLSGNQLLTKAVIDRDTFEFENINGILSLWIKLYYITNPYIANYYKVFILNS
jgi:hypothetical protein